MFFLVIDWVFPVVVSVLAVFLRHVVSSGVTTCLTFLARLWHTIDSEMPNWYAPPVGARQLGEALQKASGDHLW